MGCGGAGIRENYKLRTLVEAIWVIIVFEGLPDFQTLKEVAHQKL